MNRELYTDEFRNLKYLKSQPDLVRQFRRCHADINKIRPVYLTDDTSFKWKHRVEFLEQLFDLREETLYIVEPCTSATIKNSSLEEYEDARLHEIYKPIIFCGNPFLLSDIHIATESDIPDIENPSGNNYYIASRDMVADLPFSQTDMNVTGKLWKTIPMVDTSMVQSSKNSYVCMFSDRLVAADYRDAISKYLKNYFDTVSTIVARL